MFWFPFVLLCFVAFAASTDTQGTRILYTADRRICQNITWELENRDIYVNKIKTMIKGDGLVNVTTTTVICCPGFHKNHKQRCKKCPRGTYGLGCLKKCDCTDFQKCHYKTGECKKCIEMTCEDDEDADDDGSAVPTKTNSIITNIYGSVQTTTDSDTKTVLSTIRTCGVCKEFGNCSSELQCSVFSDLHDSDTSRKTDKWTIIIIVLSISVIGNVTGIVFGLIRFRRRRQQKQSQIASVIQLPNEVNHDGENIMVESSQEYLQMTDDCHSYNALDSNRAYVSMYNEIQDPKQYTNDLKPNNIEREKEKNRHSVDNDYDTVD